MKDNSGSTILTEKRLWYSSEQAARASVLAPAADTGAPWLGLLPKRIYRTSWQSSARQRTASGALFYVSAFAAPLTTGDVNQKASNLDSSSQSQFVGGLVLSFESRLLKRNHHNRYPVPGWMLVPSAAWVLVPPSKPEGADAAQSRVGQGPAQNQTRVHVLAAQQFAEAPYLVYNGLGIVQLYN